MTPPLAAGLFLTIAGLIALSFNLYALLRGGRGQRGDIGPISERGVHVIAGVRMPVRLETYAAPAALGKYRSPASGGEIGPQGGNA